MNSEPSPNQLPSRVGQVWVRQEGDEAAIYDPANGSLHRLNPSALAIWELCDGRTTLEELVAALVEITDADTEAATNDVLKALDDLRRSGLVE